VEAETVGAALGVAHPDVLAVLETDVVGVHEGSVDEDTVVDALALPAEEPDGWAVLVG
jgi:hypothetical protein